MQTLGQRITSSYSLIMTIPEAQQTPMMRQFLAIKETQQDAILFFRLGDFYEMFFDDAITASKELDLTLTGRGKDVHRVPMCGVPHHAAEGYIQKLIDKGYKVAICEQVENPDDSQGITKREVVKVVTPATHMSETHIDQHENMYLAAIQPLGQQFGFSIVDISTGEFKCGIIESKLALDQTIARFQPKEFLIPLDYSLDYQGLTTRFNPLPPNSAIQKFCTFFNCHRLDSFGLNSAEKAISCAWAIIDYLSTTQQHALPQLNKCLLYNESSALILDDQTIRNLELFQPLFKSHTKHTLFGVINKTKTAMGGRCLRHWMLHPLTQKTAIEKRYAAVLSLKNDVLSREEIREQLQPIYDLERLLSRIVSNGNNPRDVLALCESLQHCREFSTILSHLNGDLLQQSAAFFQQLSQPDHPIQQLIHLITTALINPAPANLTKGHVISPDYHQELADLIQSFKDIKDWIGSLEEHEQQRTGIKTLRVGFNKVFGYYFQISKGQTHAVPDDYIRKQTLTNAERYITPELKDKETVLLHGEEKQIALEQRLFQDIIESIKDQIKPIQAIAQQLAQLDVLQGLATVAQQQNYCQPELVDNSLECILTQSRHPVLEKQLHNPVIANDIQLNNDHFILLITGPNMAGKSTVMKQVALTTIMAQMGSFVPASSAKIGLVDQCFTRIGAADNLASGQSTFMVEMTETATILHNASPKSLILLDEIGRGTSTYDGMSIAGAVVYYIHSHIRARTLFATHYHELTSITNECNHVKNMSMAIEEFQGKLAFTYQLIAGPADKSYGIHVAEMAGLPIAVVDHASQLLAKLEDSNVTEEQLVLF